MPFNLLLARIIAASLFVPTGSLIQQYRDGSEPSENDVFRRPFGKHAVLISGLMRAGSVCFPTLLRVLGSTTSDIDFYASIAHTRFGQNTTNDINTLAFLRAMPSLRGLRIDDFRGDELSSEARVVMPSFPYAKIRENEIFNQVHVALHALHLSKGWDLIRDVLGAGGHR